MNQHLRRIFTGALLACVSGLASAGPVILGGDDLTDHGSRSGGANLEGWLYIQKAVDNILSSSTRGGAITTDIVALGSAANPAFSAGNAGGAIGSAANVLGRTVTFIDGAAAIDQFFIDLAAGLINPSMLWIAGTGAANDLLSDEGLALSSNAAAINAFGASGGGIMSHGSGAVAYGWLSTLLPGLTEVSGCSSTGATLTAAGNAAFPGLSNSDIDANAGPCHSSFTGDFGGLTTLAIDGAGRSYIIGGGAGTVIRCGGPGEPPCPTPEPDSLPLVALAGAGLLAQQWRRRTNRSGKSST